MQCLVVPKHPEEVGAEAIQERKHQGTAVPLFYKKETSMKTKWTRVSRSIIGALAILLLALHVGCGAAPEGSCSSDNDCKGDRICTNGSCTSPTPATIELNCATLCKRTAECVVELCSEDIPAKASQYPAVGRELEQNCLAACDNSNFQALTETKKTELTCMFQKSCRAVFGQDSCNAQATYNCQ